MTRARRPNRAYREAGQWPPAKRRKSKSSQKASGRNRIVLYVLRKLLQHGGHHPKSTTVAGQRLACFLPDAKLAVTPDFMPVSDSILAGKGIFVLRFTRNDILANPERVMRFVQDACLERKLPSPSATGPDPQGGNPDQEARPVQDARKSGADTTVLCYTGQPEQRIAERTNDATAARS